MLKIRDNVDLKELEKFGFKNINNIFVYERKIDSQTAYIVYITKRHRYIQIKTEEQAFIAGSLQTLIYDLIQAGYVEKVKE